MIFLILLIFHNVSMHFISTPQSILIETFICIRPFTPISTYQTVKCRMIPFKIWHGALDAKLFCCFYSVTLIDKLISYNEMANDKCSKLQSNLFLMCFFNSIITNLSNSSPLLCISISVKFPENHSAVHSKYTADMLQCLR